jgi:hypothetical protein
VNIGDPDVDRYIEAYYVLGIDIVPMILDNHQLPQMDLVRDIYLQQIRQVHPDKNPNVDAVGTSARLNDSFTMIKTLMRSADDQLDFIQPILQYFHKGAFPPLPYILLFFAGGFVTILLLK